MSIVVGVRVRPFNTREKDRNSVCCIQMPGGNQTIITDDLGKEKKFTFDHSFGLMMVITHYQMVIWNPLMINMQIKK